MFITKYFLILIKDCCNLTELIKEIEENMSQKKKTNVQLHYSHWLMKFVMNDINISKY